MARITKAIKFLRKAEATLVDQRRGAELEYRIIAVHQAGENLASNSVMVVL